MLNELISEVFVYISFNYEAFSVNTSLSISAHPTLVSTIYSFCDVRVSQNTEWIVTSQLKRHFL
jgi:hypothetical protein